MDITLCMVVKNEIHNLKSLLKPSLMNHFDDIIIVDTGSSDGTKEFVMEELMVKCLESKISYSTASSKTPCRNLALDHVKTDWVFFLDADERIKEEDLESIKLIEPTEEVSGYFGRWVNYLGDRHPFSDYKLFLYRKGVKVRGLVHENATVDLRINNKIAIWTDLFTVKHFPDPKKSSYKTRFYEERLLHAIEIDPSWARNYWFLGYMLYQKKILQNRYIG